VAGVEQFDVGEVGAPVMAPVEAEFQEDADVGAAALAERRRVVGAVAQARFYGVGYRVEDGRGVARQP